MFCCYNSHLTHTLLRRADSNGDVFSISGTCQLPAKQNGMRAWQFSRGSANGLCCIVVVVSRDVLIGARGSGCNCVHFNHNQSSAIQPGCTAFEVCETKIDISQQNKPRELLVVGYWLELHEEYRCARIIGLGL